MTKRIRHKLGICRRYMEDFYATRLFFEKKISRVSIVIRKQYKERFEKLKLKKLHRLLKNFNIESLKAKILSKYSKNIKNLMKINANLHKLRSAKMQAYNHNQTHIVIGKIRYFLYRIDIGRPKEKRIKRNKHFLMLMARQKIRRFCSQFPLKVLRKYLQLIRHQTNSLNAFFILLETRLDFILYRMNIMTNKPCYFRQLINHNSFKFILQNKYTNLSGQHLLKIGEIFRFSFQSKRYFYYNIQKKFILNKIFMSIPNYLFINYKLMNLLFYKFPSIKTLSYPIRLAFLTKRLPTMGYRFP